MYTNITIHISYSILIHIYEKQIFSLSLYELQYNIGNIFFHRDM